MVINNIDYPYEIIKAINEDNLVIFAGAGVSINPPTNLPSFVGLAEKIAKVNGCTYDSDKDTVDEFLGDLERRNIRIKEHVCEVLCEGNPKPNEFHFNIIKLFDKNAIRIVTTNQDEMFQQAARHLKITTKSYNAPALPNGNDFCGIINIHGVVTDPKNIVITDTDFGNAYMLNGYASRFLSGLFKRYTVLFVGYSYNDRIVRYLTSAITATIIPNAFILNDWGDVRQLNKLTRTKMRSISYPSGCHEQACSSLGLIGQYTKRGLFDWKQRINILESEKPPIDPGLRDEVLDGIKQLSIQKIFCSKKLGIEWAIWLNDNNVFDTLFTREKELTENDKYWAEWLASNYLSTSLLRIINLHNSELNKEFSTIILQSFVNNQEIDSSLFSMYLSLLKKDVDNDFLIIHLMAVCCDRKMYDLMWDLFTKLLEYTVAFDNSTLSLRNHTYSITCKWKYNEDLVQFAWKNYLAANNIYPFRSFELCVRIIESIYIDFRYVTEGHYCIFQLDFFDIENNEKYCPDAIVQLICSIIEQSCEKLTVQQKDLCENLIDGMIVSSYGLIRRLGLLLLRKYSSRSAQEIFGIINEHFNFFELAEKEQLFKLISSVFDEICDSDRINLIKKIMDESDKPYENPITEDQLRTYYYNKYNILIWIQNNCRKTEEVKSAIKKIKENYPYFLPREHPELSFGPASFKWGSKSPIKMQELNSLSGKEAYLYIKDFKETNSFDGPDRHGLLLTLKEVCSRDFNWGLEYLKEIIANSDLTEDIWDYSLSGLAASALNEKRIIDVIECLSEEVIEKRARYIAYFLYVSIKSGFEDKEKKESFILYIVKKVRKLWKYRCDTISTGSDYFQMSLNTTTGWLTFVLMMLIENPNPRKGIPIWLDDIINDVIDKSPNIEEYVCVICGYTGLLFYIDSGWTKTHVFSYLTNSDTRLKIAAWQGFLQMVKNFNVELGTALLPIFKQQFDIRKEMSEELRHSFIHDYVLLFTHIEENPYIKYVSDLIADGSIEDKVVFASSISTILENMEQGARNELWNKWLKDYWSLRNKNIPVKLEDEEYSEMIFWPFYFEQYTDAVNLAVKSNAKVLTLMKLCHHLSELDVINKYPDQTAGYLVSIIKKSEIHKPDYITAEVVAKLKESVSNQKIIEDLETAFD